MKTFLAAILLITTVGCGDLMYKRHFEGTVVSIGSRYSRNGGNGGQEKYALQLKDYKGDQRVADTSGGGGRVAVECVSTRCAALQEGQCVQLLCRHDVRLLEPDIIMCKMVRLCN